MKKTFAFISILAVLSAFMFADVSATKNADGTVDVTFFYGNPRATEVLLAGDFTSWQDGALPMTKVENGFTITHTFKAGDEARYKFISDGNWTTDLRAPDFVDDGFGGKNSHIVIADLIGGGDDDGASRARINFVSWTMIGAQANYLTQGASDASKKGMDLDSVTFGMKSYNKFTGNFLPNAPVYIEIALAETEMEDYAGNTADKLNYLYRNSSTGDPVVTWQDGLLNFVNGIFTNPVASIAKTTDNKDNAGSFGAIPGPGSNPFLGHLKFGWNTPYVNYTTGFNYAKPDVRQAITWKTIDGNWDAGYNHVGGFNVFSMGDKVVAGLEELTGLRFDVGVAPNKTGDRKGTKYGYWAWAGVSNDLFAVDFQSNGIYDGDYIFSEPVEHDFILGAKTELDVGDGKLNIAAQGLAATHQMDSAALKASNGSGTADYFGYSTDVFYRSGNFDGLKNLAGNVQVGYKADMFGANLEYRFRGAEASMLYVRENHDDGTFDLSEQLGVLNSQRVGFDGWIKPLDALQINLGVTAEMPLENIKTTDALVQGWINDSGAWGAWYAGRFSSAMSPLFGVEGGAELVFTPEVSYTLEDYGITIGAYGDLKYNAYTVEAGGFGADYIGDIYSASNSKFLAEVAGLTFAMKPDSDIIKGVNVYYGLDMSNDVRWFNTLVGKVDFPMDISASLAFGLKSENKLSADASFNKDTNNPFAFAVGVSKKFSALKKPILYAQFVYNMDPFKHFGDGQDALNLDRGNVKGSHEKEARGIIDPVDWYDGKAAMRVGIRWDI